MGDQILVWPSGMGGFKLRLNYVPGFAAQHAAAALSQYQQLLQLLGGTVTKAGSMNVFAAFDRTDSGV
jgi:branched-subunit amino acid aminotransferase/4-amino-4-deoxychorismate lyase